MTTDRTPELPARSGRTRLMVERFRQRRHDLGWSQQEVADRIVEYSAKVAREFNEPQKFKTLSGQMVSRWENMYKENATHQQRSARINMAVLDFAMWARVLGMRIDMTVVGAEDDGQLVFLDDEALDLVFKFNNLRPEHRTLVQQLVKSLSPPPEDDGWIR